MRRSLYIGRGLGPSSHNKRFYSSWRDDGKEKGDDDLLAGGHGHDSNPAGRPWLVHSSGNCCDCSTTRGSFWSHLKDLIKALIELFRGLCPLFIG